MFRSILKPSESTMASAATVGFVIAVYQMNLGTGAQVHATDPNHPVLESSRKKAGYTALAGVAALTLLTKDVNIGILGGGTIIAMELTNRHAIMSNPITGKMEAPEGAARIYAGPSLVPEAEPDASEYDASYG